MTKILVLLSVMFNTFGFSGISQKVDTNLVSQSAGATIHVSASPKTSSLPLIALYPSVSADASTPRIYAKNYILVDSDSGVILASQKANDKVPVASTTKIMTAIVVLENYKLDEVATVPKETIQTVASYGATPDFYSEERMTVKDLLYCLLMNSSNAAAYTLAEHMNIAGESGIEKFVEKMNQRARELGMNNSNFRDPAGLDGSGYSTAHDLTIATKQALKNELFAEIVKTKQTTVYDLDGRDVHPLNNSNRLVNEYNYPGAIGVKTGFMPDDPSTPGAGHCLVAAVRRDGHTLISVVLNTSANSPTASADESVRLQNWGWASVSWGK